MKHIILFIILFFSCSLFAQKKVYVRMIDTSGWGNIFVDTTGLNADLAALRAELADTSSTLRTLISTSEVSLYTNDGTIDDAVRAVTLGSNDINFDANTLFIDGSADRVGIGTTSPAGALTVDFQDGEDDINFIHSGTDTFDIQFRENNTATTGIRYDGSDKSKLEVYNYVDDIPIAQFENSGEFWLPAYAEDTIATTAVSLLGIASTGKVVNVGTSSKITSMGEINYFSLTGDVITITSASTLGYDNMVKVDVPTTLTPMGTEFDDGGVDGRLRYIGAGSKHFHCAASVSFGGGNSDLFSIGIAKNDTIVITAGPALRKMGAAGDIGSTAFHGMISLNTGDYIEVFIGNNTDTDDPTIYSFNLFAATMIGVGAGNSPWVNNLDDIYYDLGNVGIGTTSPSAKLHIASTDNVSMILEDGNTALSDGEASGTIQWKTNDSGNEGINAEIQTEGDGSTGIASMNFNLGTVGALETRMHIDGSSGNVGIGTTSPSAKLDIDAGSNTTGIRLRGLAETSEIGDISMSSTGALLISTVEGTDNAAYIDLRSEDDQYGILIRESDGTGTTPFANLYVTDAANDYLSININSAKDGDALVVTEGNSVGIGTAIPTEKLDIVGELRVRTIGAGTYNNVVNMESDGTLTTATSDRRMKRNINAIDSTYALEKILQLNPVTFKWKDSYKIERDSALIERLKSERDSLNQIIDTDSLTQERRKQITDELKEYRDTNRKRKENAQRTNIGLIAQDVLEVLPEAVGMSDNGYYFLRENNIYTLLIGAIKAQDAKIDKLEKALRSQQNINDYQSDVIVDLIARIIALENK